MKNYYDVIVVGGGIAGMTAAIYTTRGGANTLLIEKEVLGGQLNSAPLIENYPGFPPTPGAEIAESVANQVRSFNIPIVQDTVVAIGKGWKQLVVETEEDYLFTRSVIIATGAKYKELPHSENYEALSYCPTCDGAFYRGRPVAVIGDGNSALQYALSLASVCSMVFLCTLTHDLFAERTMISRMWECDNIKHIPNVTTTGYEDGRLFLKTENGVEQLPVDGVFVAIGQEPSTDCVPSRLKENNGYIVNLDCKTPADGVFTAGDCRVKKGPCQAVISASDGVQAAMLALDYLKSISNKL